MVSESFASWASLASFASHARIWRHFGDAMVSKLLPSSQSGKWQHCADEGQICLCLGEAGVFLKVLRTLRHELQHVTTIDDARSESQSFGSVARCTMHVEVRFGLETFEVNASELVQQWASETLLAKNGLVFCTEDGALCVTL